ncbi:relaxase/mobilization nuclease domain-containing protein [Hespellia stercorisuis]|uniref:Relaxase/Mobilisation nuclease domain-containing protein n=1 Tax=Hespellia stercorisuis DSM 15480 TaxID=1121950 RepID=A0A1M6NUW5_9FIRM|nr:relaxase/mobilization nuclease domain-containing protein [Hespellia stercorisuis]SHJ99539.1 Relaxase/Mobilisation nuclease domain-containing protein [Hespellia stercorisuis DSM 15480]
MGRIEVSIPEGKYDNQDAVEKVISYILRLDNPQLVGGYGIVPTSLSDIINQFIRVKQYYGKTDGKQIFHIVFSVERTLCFKTLQVKEIGRMLAAYWGMERQVVFAVHDDTRNIHIHMGINTVSFLNGSYKGFYDLDEIKKYANHCVDKITDKVWFGKS